ncbi:MAG TPA: UDP-N-acetylmuramate:L-alanyl-gamma-D-glutamyl-meso-diaminopimelate ligase [Gammaproteobacteria bacterium]|jgi:UDP-N-acetylmuramate: L-alanyl-gamma-D-glutamyl-meso-diaminopimelate ligase|nr:UDP-N-acetylmuramate:L-alanyl-gamma-D-glutamyl-meso-diaminopimelate ligase [Chromatiales bacterium]MCP4926895.1 UDP-N-acetylmuramate:L-alanyl-gamma-D-glutamyl-meso-diaminopimelate ligase [Gammaproteobacteria bacterium]MDP7295870.1 UDP-N-acetylmuramate:L-alanyl-gamma-D-glutamyl-meso-diaminopimelate ligase [Gammaproteobacteria bacterium]MDP7661207.1 UDP-N-acetylmuramate:L-alanyl-gamma-D-glutamyl-meso-diaminopimelate ligase [Gammaproteobacteria bacterium]HJP37997.1 UDP-N-acetylmuramate:L-alanyl
MHLHILGICGTFMAGIAAIARAAGHRVTGADLGVYPPMSEQLADLGIDIIDGYQPDQLELQPDVIIIGNVMSRGMPIIEAILNRRMAYMSGPQWLVSEVLADQQVVAVAGTHGKTTTTSLLAFILEQAGLKPGFLIGGRAVDFDVSARLGAGSIFVLEADEYDTAFFDKRAKFLHYHPDIQIISNLEFDHADIYADLEAIQWQFHQLLRMLPGNGRLIIPADDDNVRAVVERGCWTPIETFSSDPDSLADWKGLADHPGQFSLMSDVHVRGTTAWNMIGAHNAENAVAALIAAQALGVSVDQAITAIGRFGGVRRRLELRGTWGGVSFYDEFAHHPTAIKRTIDALRRDMPDGRLLVILEPRSNTMKLGVHANQLAAALDAADEVWVYRPAGLGWDLGKALRTLNRVQISDDIGSIAAGAVAQAMPGDKLVVMSNGGFGGIHSLLEAELGARFP